MELLNRHITCPYCGESIELLIDDSAADHMSMTENCSLHFLHSPRPCGSDGRYKGNAGAVAEDYFEDCSVCCRPIRIQLNVDFEGDCQLTVLRDDE